MSCRSTVDCCRNCPHWGGNKYTEWGDCFRVFLTLDPALKEVRNRFGHLLEQPFDPHDLKYVRERLPKLNLPKGVRTNTLKETDLTLDDEGNERIKRVKVVYYQTKYDYLCEEE